MRVALGVLALLLGAWVTMYGKLWCFERYEAHRMTARAMLSGTLRLRALVSHAGHDEQIHNGAVYTNWGFGVPLLQLPFQALASGSGMLHGFFPDRAIYFFYLTVLMLTLWAALDRLLDLRRAGEGRPGERLAVSWAATWLALNVTLFPFMSTRFVVFEETLAYMDICELAALSAYVFALGRWRTREVVAMGVAAGLGLLVRPVGLLYVGVWGALVALERRPAKTVAYGLAVLPFAVFWLYSNWVRSGSLLGLGYANSNPAWEYEIPLLRFGPTCGDTTVHVIKAGVYLFGAFFFYVLREHNDPWLSRCHFEFEERDNTREPYFGPAILVLLVGLLVRIARRRERRPAMFVPYAAFAALFVLFVRRGEGFAWRYVGDFWPLIVLAVVQDVHFCAAAELAPIDLRLAKVMFWAGLINLSRLLVPWQWSERAEILPTSATAEMEREFEASRWGVDETLPSRISRDNLPTEPRNNARGWTSHGSVNTFTNVYLGIPPRTDDRYKLRFETIGMTAPTVRVYVNGEIATAHRRGETYEAEVVLHASAFTAPIVVVTVEWARMGAPPSGKLLSIELV